MSTTWNCEIALEEVADAIDEGSVKLDLNDETRKLVKELYRADFAVRTEVEWRARRSTLLDMARKAGSCAETATIVLWVNGIGTIGKSLDRETVLLVCVMVSRLYCSLGKGVWCSNVDYTEPKGKKLDQILGQIGALD
jgi:hypothetical protein